MQQVNFFSELPREEVLAFAARQQLKLCAATAVIMLVAFLGFFAAGFGLKEELGALTVQRQQAQQRVDALEESRQQKLVDTELDDKLLRLEREVAFRRQLLASVDPDAGPVATGFAEHLNGLGRQVIDGLWFTEIELYSSGKQMVLTGSTLEPEYLPRYLKKLSAERVFSGHQFQVLRLTAPEDSFGDMNFEVRTLPGDRVL